MAYIEYDQWAWGNGDTMEWGNGDTMLCTRVITDAGFLQWIRSANNFTLLAEVNFGYQYAGMPAESMLYFSNRDYTSEASSGTIQYLSNILTETTFERTIDVAQLGGRGTESEDSIVLSNSDGGLDYLLRYILDGRKVSFYVGDPTWERSQFRQVGVATVASIMANSDQQITITLADQSLLLDVTIIGDTMLTGPNAGKPKPVLFGFVDNFDLTPYLFDTTGPSYYFNNYAQDPSVAFSNISVRDAGVSLINTGYTDTNSNMTANAGTDTITRNAHGLQANDVIVYSGAVPFAGLSNLVQYYVLSSVTSNTYQVSLTRGGTVVDITGTTFSGTIAVQSRRYYVNAAGAYITLSSAPSGQVTADILSQGLTGDAAIQNIPHAAFRYIIDTWTTLTLADRDAAAFSVLVAAEQAAGTQWGYAVLDRTNVQDVLDAIALATNSWYAWSRLGLLTVGKLDLANLATATAVDTIYADDIDMTTQPTYGNLVLPWGQLIADGNQNVVAQTSGLATGVSAAAKSQWSQTYQTRVQTTDPGVTQTQYLNGRYWLYHKSALISQPQETQLIGSTASMQAYCDERTKLFAPYTAVFTCSVRYSFYSLDVGQCVNLVYPRYGLSGGQHFRVIGIKLRPGDKLIDLTLVCQNIPNWDALNVGTTSPGVPTIGTAVRGNLKATVAFTPPASNGGAVITSYLVTSTPGSFTASGTASPIVVTGLSNGTGYTFKVQAINSVGTGTASAASNSVTPATTVPDVPTSVSASATSGTTATIVFSAPADNGGSAVTGYTVTSTPAGGTDSNAGSTGLSHLLTGLSPGVSYTFTSHATNANGNSAESAASNAISVGNRQITLAINSTLSGTGYNIYAQAGYPLDAVDVILTVAAGVDVAIGSSFSNCIALDTGTGWITASTIKLINLGYILGNGGIGGVSGGAGTAGMQAINMQWDMTIDNSSGFIYGGGGGGGASASSHGGGGGAAYGQRQAYDADYGGRLTGGVGGIGGGKGGDSATAGAAGSASPGGAAGNAITKNGHNITWLGGSTNPHVLGAIA